MSSETGVLSVGISDLNAHRECPRRAAYGARRHTGVGTQNEQTMTPESGSPATWFGSAIHEAIALTEDGYTDERAIELAWRMWGHHLFPEDLEQMKADLELYRERDFQNVRTVLVEGEVKVPLTVGEDGTQIYFRGKIDRLYERLDKPGHFISVDYKSSRHPKSQTDVDEDTQMWAYNWAIHETYPECVSLDQWYDQLRFGMIPTSKTDDQRRQIREWLAVEARNYFSPQPLMNDGLPAPRHNNWCPWCPILMSCEIVPRLSDWALSTIGASVPGEAEALAEMATPIDEYISRFTEAQDAAKALETYLAGVKAWLREQPLAEQARLGFEFRGRSRSTISPMSVLALQDRLGAEEFVKLVSLSQEAVKKIADPEIREWAQGLFEKADGPKVLYRRKGSET